MNNLQLHQGLFLRSNFYKLRINYDHNILRGQVNKYKHFCKHYNPRKTDVKRTGLSLTSLDGNLSGVPDLDSLPEYNKINNTDYTELDFIQKTQVWKDSNLDIILEPLLPHICRSHVIYLPKGGFFPPHVDSNIFKLETFRLILPLQNSNYPKCIFLQNDKILFFEYGWVYVLNTAIEHTIFSFDDNINIIINVKLCEESVKIIYGLIAT